jgi:phosphatidylcholine synthase
LASLYHVVDLGSKTEEGYFVGFPAIWNVVLLYLFALAPRPEISLAIIGAFVALTFVPLLAVHPFRVSRLRVATCIVTALWGIAAVAAIVQPFPAPLWVQVVLVATAVYLSLIGLCHWLLSANVQGKSS